MGLFGDIIRIIINVVRIFFNSVRIGFEIFIGFIKLAVKWVGAFLNKFEVLRKAAEKVKNFFKGLADSTEELAEGLDAVADVEGGADATQRGVELQKQLDIINGTVDATKALAAEQQALTDETGLISTTQQAIVEEPLGAISDFGDLPPIQIPTFEEISPQLGDLSEQAEKISEVATNIGILAQTDLTEAASSVSDFNKSLAELKPGAVEENTAQM